MTAPPWFEIGRNFFYFHKKQVSIFQLRMSNGLSNGKEPPNEEIDPESSYISGNEI